jgi:ribose transport system substrate-binding protein
VKIVGFDEDQQTLKGISEGVIDGTVVQQPYEFGYQSMITLAKIIEGDTSVIPANKQNIIPTQIVDKSNVEDFAKRIKDLLAK